MTASIAEAMIKRIERKKMTSELRKAYFATMNPDDQIMTKTHGANRSSLRDRLDKCEALNGLHR